MIRYTLYLFKVLAVFIWLVNTANAQSSKETPEFNWHIGYANNQLYKIDAVNFGSSIDNLIPIMSNSRGKLSMGMSLNSYFNVIDNEATTYKASASMGVGVNYGLRAFSNNDYILFSFQPLISFNALKNNNEMSYLSFQMEAKMPLTFNHNNPINIGVGYSTQPLITQSNNADISWIRIFASYQF